MFIPFILLFVTKEQDYYSLCGVFPFQKSSQRTHLKFFFFIYDAITFLTPTLNFSFVILSSNLKMGFVICNVTCIEVLKN